MPSLILQFENRVIKEYNLGSVITIGRLPDNSVVIDNPAVSGHHARVLRDGDHVIVEDLQSTNGTFVNEKRVSRQALRNGDVVIVGKHKLVFDEATTMNSADSPARDKVLSNMGDTMYLDTTAHRALLSKLQDAPTHGKNGSSKVGVLRVVEGRADQEEYNLEAHTCVIGAGPASLVRLQGWFKPKAAMAITRKGDNYSATQLGGKALVNGQRLNGRHDLKEGDVLRVSGLTLEFRMKEYQ